MKKKMKAVAALMLMMTMVFAAGCTKTENQNENEDGVTLTNLTPQNITLRSAEIGAKVSFPDGIEPIRLFVFWGLIENPTAASGYYREAANFSEPFVFTITDLEPNTTYHVRANFQYFDQEGYSQSIFSEDITFSTSIPYTEGNLNGHTWIDLGLPSGTLWATCNVGTSTPEQYGDYFAWGETTKKAFYKWGTYKYSNGGEDQLTKYCYNSAYGYNNFTDTLTVLQASDDAATFNWGSGWRTPTSDEWSELDVYTTKIWTTQNGVNGMLFTSPNGGSIFLPAAGNYYYHNYLGTHDLYDAGSKGPYWSSRLDFGVPKFAISWYFEENLGNTIYSDKDNRCIGLPVRAVCSAN